MAPELWQRVKIVVSAALERRPETWPAYLKDACGGDADLLDEARSLLEVSWSIGNFIERPALELLRDQLTRN